MAAGAGLLQPGAAFHTDRASNHTSDEFGSSLTGLDMCRSVDVPGTAGTTLAESFFSALKNEWLHHFVFTTWAKARRRVIRCDARPRRPPACVARTSWP
ncbi:hypothetical protein ABZ815_49315 [Nonomuraea sp. NPDC047529]|uniref:hypothetical protein n=1 Tax=Nonomuraea sp. NPDC047529 TaxID=3155623 RepID=UPI0034015D47